MRPDCIDGTNIHPYQVITGDDPLIVTCSVCGKSWEHKPVPWPPDPPNEAEFADFVKRYQREIDRLWINRT